MGFMDDASLVRRFMDADMQLTLDALDALRKREDTESAAERVLVSLREMGGRPFLITADLITKILKEENIETGPTPSVPPIRPSAPEVEAPTEREIAEKAPEFARTKVKLRASEFEPRVEVFKDITGRSYTEGKLKDFVNVFRDRYEIGRASCRERV